MELDKGGLEAAAQAVRQRTGDEYGLKTAMRCLEAYFEHAKKQSVEMRTDGFVGNGTATCHFCLKKLEGDEIKPGGVHYCPGFQSLRND